MIRLNRKESKMGTVYKRGTIWWVKYYRNGKPFFESSGSRKRTDAVNLLKGREGDIVKGVPVTPVVNRITLGELYADLVTDYEINSRKSLRHMKIRFEKHLLPYFGEQRRAVSIGTADLKRYIAERQQSKASNASINRELTSLKRAYSLAVNCEPQS